MKDVNQVQVSKPSRLVGAYNKAVVAGVVSLPALAFAAEPTAIDTTGVVATLALAVAAVGALGAAKLAPAALTWVWSLVSGMAKRG